MKKIVTFLLLLATLTSCSTIQDLYNKVFGKEEQTTAHVHAFNGTWTYDDNYHWHTAICEHKSVKGNYEKHSYTEQTNKLYDDDEIYEVTYTCSVCEYTKTVVEDRNTSGYDTTVYGHYYDSILTWENGTDLMTKLTTLSKANLTALPYEGNFDINRIADQSIDDFEMLDVVYNTEKVSKDRTSNGWAREHAFPASLMTGVTSGTAIKTKGMATDFHNLFAADAGGNSSRNNKFFGAVPDAKLNEKGYRADNYYFEPADEDKGMLARSILYMVTTYKGDNSNGCNGLSLMEGAYTYSGKDTNAPNYGKFSKKSDIIEWATKFGVDRQEYQHNETVYLYEYKGEKQGNRNPYVDYPGLVDYVFGSKKDQAGKLEDLRPSYIDLRINKDEFSNYAIKTAKRVYNVGETLNLSDVVLVDVKRDFSYTDTSSTYHLIGNVGEGQKFTKTGTYKVTVDTDKNDIEYEVEVVNDYLNSCNYLHKVDKSDIKVNSGSTINLSGVSYVLTYQGGSMGTQNGSNKGAKCGTSTEPNNVITFETVNSYTNVSVLCMKLATAKDASYTLTVYVNGKVVGTTKVTYNSNDVSSDFGFILQTPVSGKIKFELTNVNKTIYIDYIGFKAD